MLNSRPLSALQKRQVRCRLNKFVLGGRGTTKTHKYFWQPSSYMGGNGTDCSCVLNTKLVHRGGVPVFFISNRVQSKILL